MELTKQSQCSPSNLINEARVPPGAGSDDTLALPSPGLVLCPYIPPVGTHSLSGVPVSTINSGHGEGWGGVQEPPRFSEGPRARPRRGTPTPHWPDAITCTHPQQGKLEAGLPSGEERRLTEGTCGPSCQQDRVNGSAWTTDPGRSRQPWRPLGRDEKMGVRYRRGLVALPVLLWWHFLSCVTLREKKAFRWAGRGESPRKTKISSAGQGCEAAGLTPRPGTTMALSAVPRGTL